VACAGCRPAWAVSWLCRELAILLWCLGTLLLATVAQSMHAHRRSFHSSIGGTGGRGREMIIISSYPNYTLLKETLRSIHVMPLLSCTAVPVLSPSHQGVDTRYLPHSHVPSSVRAPIIKMWWIQHAGEPAFTLLHGGGEKPFKCGRVYIRTNIAAWIMYWCIYFTYIYITYSVPTLAAAGALPPPLLSCTVVPVLSPSHQGVDTRKISIILMC